MVTYNTQNFHSLLTKQLSIQISKKFGLGLTVLIICGKERWWMFRLVSSIVIMRGEKHHEYLKVCRKNIILEKNYMG